MAKNLASLIVNGDPVIERKPLDVVQKAFGAYLRDTLALTDGVLSVELISHIEPGKDFYQRYEKRAGFRGEQVAEPKIEDDLDIPANYQRGNEIKRVAAEPIEDAPDYDPDNAIVTEQKAVDPNAYIFDEGSETLIEGAPADAPTEERKPLTKEEAFALKQQLKKKKS